MWPRDPEAQPCPGAMGCKAEAESLHVPSSMWGTARSLGPKEWMALGPAAHSKLRKAAQASREQAPPAADLGSRQQQNARAETAPGPASGLKVQLPLCGETQSLPNTGCHHLSTGRGRGGIPKEGILNLRCPAIPQTIQFSRDIKISQFFSFV